MVVTQAPPFFAASDIASLLGRGLAMAALFGGLTLGAWLVDALRLKGEMIPFIPSYAISCSMPSQGHQISEETDCSTSEEHKIPRS